jgi:hypothetical protein
MNLLLARTAGWQHFNGPVARRCIQIDDGAMIVTEEAVIDHIRRRLDGAASR